MSSKITKIFLLYFFFNFLNAENDDSTLTQLHDKIVQAQKIVDEAQQKYVVARGNFETCEKRIQERRRNSLISFGTLGAACNFVLTKRQIWRGFAYGCLAGLCLNQLRTWHFAKNTSYQSPECVNEFPSGKNIEYNILKNKYWCSSYKDNHGSQKICSYHQLQRAKDKYNDSYKSLFEEEMKKFDS